MREKEGGGEIMDNGIKSGGKNSAHMREKRNNMVSFILFLFFFSMTRIDFPIE